MEFVTYMNGKIGFEIVRRGRGGHETTLSHASLLLNKCGKVVLGVRDNHFSECVSVPNLRILGQKWHFAYS